MFIVIDSNIIISALINSKGSEFEILNSDNPSIDFVITTFLKDEFKKKHLKIASLTNAAPESVLFQFHKLTETFTILNPNEIDHSTLQKLRN